jgi:N-acetylgalactosamine-6-sulfatase
MQGTGAPIASGNEGRPNVVFVLVDDMGYADVGCYGAKDIRTPNVDRLAREGVRMTDFYSNGPVCSPTRCCGFITGRWQQREGIEWALGVTTQGQVREGKGWRPEADYQRFGLAATEPTIARRLKVSGDQFTGIRLLLEIGGKPRDELLDNLGEVVGL